PTVGGSSSPVGSWVATRARATRTVGLVVATRGHATRAVTSVVGSSSRHVITQRVASVGGLVATTRGRATRDGRGRLVVGAASTDGGRPRERDQFGRGWSRRYLHGASRG